MNALNLLWIIPSCFVLAVAVMALVLTIRRRNRTKKHLPRKGNNTNLPPIMGRRFYMIVPQDNGTVDVYLRPHVIPMSTSNGAVDYDVEIRVVRGVVPWDHLEDDVRRRYEAWCESAETIYL